MSTFTTLSDAIARFVRPGHRLALEGFTHLIPFAAGHEIIRQGLTDLTLVRMTPDLLYDQMIGSGCARKLVFSWGGNPGVGSLHRLRDAVERGWPRPLEIEEHSHSAMAHAYAAGAAGMPSAFFRGYFGSDLAKVNPNIKFITCPFTGEQLASVPAHRPDVTIIHAQKADRSGNVLLEGIIGVQKEAVLAARAAIVTVEEIVDRFELGKGGLGTNAVILPSWTVHAIVAVPGGAHPSYAHGYYARDNAFYVAWDAIARDRDSFQRWIQEHVMTARPETFAERVRASHAEAGMTAAPYTAAEMMTVAAARALAQRRHLLCRDRAALRGVQPGAADARTPPDARLRVRHARNQADRAAALDRRRRALRDRADDRLGTGDVPGTWLQGGRISVGFLGGAQIDRFGNLNSTVIGPYDKPKVRLPGSGGATEIATGCQRIYVVMRHNPRAFVQTLAFVTSLGHGVTGRERREMGIRHRRPGAGRDRPVHDDARRGDEGIRGGEPAPRGHPRTGTRAYGLGRPFRRAGR